jgi:hypothetical protein
VRTLERRHFDRATGTTRLRADYSKTKRPHELPVIGELLAVIERRQRARKLNLPWIFHRRERRIGDRTAAMLRRHHIVNVDDLRRADELSEC